MLIASACSLTFGVIHVVVNTLAVCSLANEEREGLLESGTVWDGSVLADAAVGECDLKGVSVILNGFSCDCPYAVAAIVRRETSAYIRASVRLGQTP